jgi:hypothetical protein
MEINELVTYFFNSDTNTIEVSFRTINDSEDMIRIDNIDISISEDYGFDLIIDNFDFFDDNDDFDDFEEENKITIDEYMLISFLNEYYVVNPNTMPNPEMF